MILLLSSFIINNYWTTNDLGQDALASKIEYKSSTCSKYNFIQSVKVIDNKNLDFIWKLGESPRNILKSTNGYFIDHQANHCDKNKPCSPFYISHWNEGGQAGTITNPAKMEDYPYGWSEFQSIQLEACIKCEDDNQIKECITWGGNFPVIGDKIIYPNKISSPSKDFMEALAKFNKYYNN